MGVAGLCSKGNSDDQESSIVFEIEKPDIENISIEKFMELIPKSIINKINGKNIDMKNNKNSEQIKTVKMKDESGQNDDEKKTIYYHGEFNEQDEKDGLGKMIIINNNNEKIIYQGIWQKNVLSKGNIYYPKKGEYSGQMKNYMRDGKGKYISDDETYEGDWKEDKKDGNGIIIYKDGCKYEGQFKNNKIEGIGKMSWIDGTYYSGEFKNNIFNGKGVLKGNNNHIYNGYFQNGIYNGEGEFKWINEDTIEIYKGNYLCGKRNGNGEFHFKNGHIYRGRWEGGSPHGKGIYETKNRKYFANWRSGLFIKLIDAQNKENFEEENIDLNFKTQAEDICFLEHLSTSLNSDSSFQSSAEDDSIESAKIKND